MKKKKWFSVLLVAIMVLTMAPGVTFATETTGGEVIDTYEELVSALENAETEDTIEIAGNIELSGSLPGTAISGKTLTINGNEHEITFNQADTAQGVFGNNNNPLYENTTLRVNNLKITNTGDNGGWASILGYNAGGSNIHYDDCTFTNLGAAVYVNPITIDPAGSVIGIDITNCTFEDTSYQCGMDETSEGAYKDVIITNFENNTGDFDELPQVTNTVYAEVSGYAKSFGNDIQEAVNNADDGSTVIVMPGTYDGNIKFNGKNLSIEAMYPAYANGERESDESKLSEFTGTFNTFGENSDSFYEEQNVFISGFALSGNGLKIGNNNYNSVGNLVVSNCTMKFGENLSNASENDFAGLNYFVKTNGAAGVPYASVNVYDNYVAGTPNENIFPIQLWDVEHAFVADNTIILEDAVNHQAVSIAKMKGDAEIQVTDNEISGAGGGIYITTWLLDGNTEDGKAVFTGSVNVSDNVLTGAGTETFDPIFLGYESVEGVPYGIMGGTLTAIGNTNNGEAIEAVIGEMENEESNRITATFKDGETIIGTITATPENGEDSVAISLPDAIYKEGYIFAGWSDGQNSYGYLEEVNISEDTTFEAVWEVNEEPVGPADPDDPSTNPDNPAEQPNGQGNNAGQTDASYQTGDDSNMLIWLGLILIAVLGGTGTIIYGRKRKYSK